MRETTTFCRTARLRLVSLPLGWRKAKCPKCGSHELTGAIITPTADDFDPNILCERCHWFD